MKKKVFVKPWGGEKQYTLNEVSTVKILTVKPKQKISLQYHHKRKEFWIVLDNPVKITIGNKVFKAKKGDELTIPKKTKHRIEACNKTVNILEISMG